MVEETTEGASFRVVFFDGLKETNIGFVVVYESMEFKAFQLTLARRIGISPNQFSVYLADNKKPLYSSSETRRRTPITSKVNFGVIISQTDCFFLVVLKRSRRDRRRKSQKLEEENYHYSLTMKTQETKKKNPPENVMILRRNNTGIEKLPLSGFFSSSLDLSEYVQRIHNLQLPTKERCRDLNNGNEKTDVLDLLVCKHCATAKKTGTEVGFHWCVNDAVTVGFRSDAGPIARPVREFD